MHKKEYLEEYFKKAQERLKLGIEPLPLDVEETSRLCELIENPPEKSAASLLDLIENRIQPGVDESAKVKAEFLRDIALGIKKSAILDKKKAVELLGLMKGGYNTAPLIGLLEDPALGSYAKNALEQMILIYDAFDDVKKLCDRGVPHALELMKAWAAGTWFTSRPKLEDSITLKVFKVTGEVTTDDLSPAQDAWSRPDIPLHALSMFKNSREGLKADEEGVRGPVSLINDLKKEQIPLVFVADVVGTGSSRKSGTNSLLWHIGSDIKGVPNKRGGGFVFGGRIAPIFYNTLEDSGALPLEMDVSKFITGRLVDLKIKEGTVVDHQTGEVLSSFKIRSETLLDEVRAGGRINLIIGRALTFKAAEYLGLGKNNLFAATAAIVAAGGFTRAQKIIGMSCGRKGVTPGEYVEVSVATVGSQDTTGPMTRDELKDLACLKFQSPLVMQSFCHTAAYPKSVDITTQKTLPKFIEERGGVSLRPGDGVIHCFLNRMCLPHTVGTGGDSHTRMPLGISFPAGSGLVAFAAATGMMPLDVPESVLVRFKGKRKSGITLRDLVNAIPYFAIKKGLLTIAGEGRKNIFSGRILEIEGLEDLEVEHAFEIANSSAERSAAACSIALNREPVVRYLLSNASFLRRMAKEGYQCSEALLARAQAQEEAAEHYQDVKADADASYAAVLEIDLDEVTEPIVCVPNDPDDVRLLSEVQDTKIDEVFIGSCMTNIGHYRASSMILEDLKQEVPVRLWLAPPTRMDGNKLKNEGLTASFARAGARIEIPGCSLCMGNQARVRDNASVVSTSTRNFPNRLGKGARVYLASAELACVTARLGRLPKVGEYFDLVKVLQGSEGKIYRLLDFKCSEN